MNHNSSRFLFLVFPITLWAILLPKAIASQEIAPAFSILTVALVLSLGHFTLSNRLAFANGVFHYYFIFGIILPGIAQLSNGFFWLSHVSPTEYSLEASLIILLSILVHVIAFEYFKRKPKQISLPIESTIGGQHRVPKGKITLFAALSAFVVVLPFVKIPAFVFFQSREEMGIYLNSHTFSMIEIGAFLTLPRTICIFSIVISLALFLRKKSGPGLLLIIPAISALWLLNPNSVPRAFLVALAFSVYIVWSKRVELFQSVHTMMLLVLVAQFSVFQFLGATLRASNSSGAGILSAVDYLMHGDNDGFQSAINTLFYLDTHSFSYGLNLLSSLLFFFPRSIWPSKMEPSGEIISVHAGYTFSNISMPLPLEFFFAFGYSGVVFFGILTAYLVIRLDRLYFSPLRNFNQKIYLATYAIVVGFLPIILRGPLVSSIQPLAVTVSILLLLQTHRTKGN